MADFEKKLNPMIGDDPESLAALEVRMRARARADAEACERDTCEFFRKYGFPGRRTPEQEVAYARLRASGKIPFTERTVSRSFDEELAHCYVLCHGCIASFVYLAPNYTSEDWARVVRIAVEQGYCFGVKING